MDEPDRGLDARLSTLKKEHENLQGEAKALRSFIDALKALTDALESPQKDADVVALLDTILEKAIRAIDAEDGSLLVPDDSTNELVFAMVRGESPNEALVGRRVPAGKGVVSWVFQNRRAAIVNNAAADERFYRGVDNDINYKTHSLLAAPLIGGGRVIGVIEVINKREGKLFSIGNQTLLSVMCRFAGELLFTMVKDIDLTMTMNIPKRG
jgi:signal transduction protein with GAF and PtsI domain